jgi:MoaA/NifB/PqqE/SkfB family radical SAM enzyme
MQQALLRQRNGSAVPWLFNALVNEIEYRTGRAVLDSYPPEVHLSATGRCNIECRFCSYTHQEAYSDFVTEEQVSHLDFLRHVHTVRLSSGLGEPTANPHLPAIINHLASAFPHLGLNFFTNGVALRRRGLIDALVGQVAWINVSVNAASRETWKELCEQDLFDRLTEGLLALRQAKLARQTLLPVVYGSMVLTAKNLNELPRMPSLCRSLGIDRFTGIPFFSYGYDFPDRYGADESFHLCRDQYEGLYGETVEEARRHGVSIEIPLPADQKKTAFGLEVRSFYDFAGVEETPYRLGLLVDNLGYEEGGTPSCPQVYRTAYIGSRNRKHVASTGTHFLYPCLGPLAAVDFSTRTTFAFPGAEGFLSLWNHPIFVRLRGAPRSPGLSPVCDACRKMDTRDPQNFAELDKLLKEWEPGPNLIPSEQLTLRLRVSG